MKVSDMEVGQIYKVSADPRVTCRMGSSPKEEASRLALYILDKKNRRRGEYAASSICEPLIYLGPKIVYGGKNGDVTVEERVHHFVRPNGKRIYIYGDHIKHIQPFTAT